MKDLLEQLRLLRAASSHTEQNAAGLLVGMSLQGLHEARDVVEAMKADLAEIDRLIAQQTMEGRAA